MCICAATPCFRPQQGSKNRKWQIRPKTRILHNESTDNSLLSKHKKFQPDWPKNVCSFMGNWYFYYEVFKIPIPNMLILFPFNQNKNKINWHFQRLFSPYLRQILIFFNEIKIIRLVLSNCTYLLLVLGQMFFKSAQNRSYLSLQISVLPISAKITPKSKLKNRSW